MTSRFEITALQHLLTWRQSGVVARRQVLELGGSDNDIERMVRRRELSAVLSGVYVNHTGPLSREQREWAAVLAYWPAALTRESALRNRPLDVVEIAVALDRKLVSTERIWIHRTPSPRKIAATLASRERVSGRPMLASMISDLADGACSCDAAAGGTRSSGARTVLVS